MMGRRLDLQHLSEEECEKILEVIQRDFNIRQGEKERLTKIEESIDKEKKTREILAEKETFNENCCMRCCDTFNFIFNRKRVCIGCKYNVCKNCCVYDDNVKEYVCSTCQKHRELVTKSCDWFYQDVKRRFRRFGSAKVVRSLFKRRPESDSEGDSGYDPSLFSSMSNTTKRRSSVQDDEASDSGLGAQKPHHELDSIDGAVGIDHTKQLHLERYDKQLNSIRDKVYYMLRKRFADDHLKLKGMRPNHGLLQSYRKEVSIDLTNLAQALYLAYENHPSDEHKEINKLVQDTLVKRVESFVGHPVVVTLPNNVDEDDSAATDDDDSLCDDHPFEDQLADHIIAQILDSFKSENENGHEPIISANRHRPAPIKEGSHESLDAESEIRGNLNGTLDSEDEDVFQNSIHRSDSNRVNPLMSPRHTYSKFLSLGSPLPSFSDVQSPLGKREIDPDDLAAIEQNSDDFENIPDYDDDDDINYLERPNSVHDGNNWTLSLKDESGDKVENMEYQEWVKNIRRPSSASFTTKPINSIVNTTQEFGRVSPMIGNREVDDLTDSSICSDDDDDEVAEVTQPGDISMESREIAEITKNMSPMLNAPVANVPVEVCQPDVPKTEAAIEACTDPRFEMKPMDLVVPDGEHAQLRCRLTGTDPIDVFWYRENKKDIDQLEDDDKYEMMRDGNQYTLTIYNTTDKDAGGYICIGVNGEGQCSCTTKLSLKENSLEKKPPQFLKQLEDVEVIEGQGVRFMVKVKGYPVPRVSWFRDGRRIKSNAEYQLQQFGNRGYILTIDNVTLDNDAEYKVIAQNCLGRIMCDAQLLVEPKPKAPPKSRLNLPLKQTTPKDRSATHLDNLSQKVTMTRRRVSGTAEDILSSANKISSIDEDLHEMDRRLNNLEAEVTMTMDDDNTTPPCVRRNNCEEAIIGEYHAKKKAAGEMRKVTSSALNCLSRAERIIAAQQESLPVKRKQSISRGREGLTFSDDIQNMNDLDKSDRRDTKRKLSEEDGEPVLDFRSPPIDSRRYSRGYVGGGQADGKKQNKWDMTPTSSLHDRRRSSTRQMALADAEDEHLHKRLHTLLEKCDSKIPGGKNIYMAAGQVFSLEEKIQMLESKVNMIDETTVGADMSMLEDEVARAVAGVMGSDRQVDNVEQQVGELKKMFSRESLQSQHSTQSEAESLVDSGCGTGATTPTDLMSPRPSDIYQIEEDIVELPSVRGLMTMFNCTAQVADSGSPVARVRSLTGRDFSSSVTEKYRNKTPSSGQKGQPSVSRSSSFNIKERAMSPLAVRKFPDSQQLEATTPIGGTHPRTAGSTTQGAFTPQARSSPLPQKKLASTESCVSSASVTLSDPSAAPKINASLVNLKRFYDSGREVSPSSQNPPKIKQPLVNRNRSYDSTGHEVVTSSNQPIRATESFSTLGSPRRARTSQEKQDSHPKYVLKSDSASSQGETTPKLRRSSSSKKISSKAAFWDNRIVDNVSSDRDISLDPEVFDGQ
ncbi:uncharacterized protein LOC135499610 isoform X2 [Lineus longissimus]|uniref:uncharacterized protein LOC135499610 isoform X2 n=1 Tax=Lineus longissimus TaxID=88925 RepID=UPI00315CE07A